MDFNYNGTVYQYRNGHWYKNNLRVSMALEAELNRVSGYAGNHYGTRMHGQNHNHGGGHGIYARFEREYPHSAIISKEGFMYTSHRKSAIVMNFVMDYELVYTDNDVFTGGPDEGIIARAYDNLNLNYIIIEHGEIIDSNDGVDPFVKFNIN